LAVDFACSGNRPKTRMCWYPEGLVKLNGSAGEIMKRCDGTASIGDITADLERAFSTQGLSDDVIRFVRMAVEKSWLSLQI
jgi:pyrroloquinoline quinone biosynthesis protein D